MTNEERSAFHDRVNQPRRPRSEMERRAEATGIFVYDNGRGLRKSGPKIKETPDEDGT